MTFANVVIAVLLISMLHTVAAVKVGYSLATLLSGELTDCNTITSANCRRGTSGVAQVLREVRAEGHPVTYFPEMDRQTAFVQMHPRSWAVNAQFFAHFGWPVYLTPPSLFSERDRPGWEGLRVTGAPLPFLSNVRVDPNDRFFGFVPRTFIEHGVGYLMCSSDTQPNSVNCVSVAAVAIPYLRAQAGVQIIVLLTSESDGPRAPAQFAADLAAVGASPEVMIFTRSSAPVNATTYNGSICIGAESSASVVRLVDIRFSGPHSVQSVTMTSRSIDITGAQRTAAFYADINYTKVEAAKAAANDPVVGYSTFMPFTRVGTFRKCMAGECPLGALVTNSMRWKFQTDVAFTPSGGTRGPGWPAGPVRVSNIWAALPFANTVCTGRILGLRLWELINTSYGLATFNENVTDMGDRLLQVAGMRVRYAKHLPQYRISSIEVLNRATNMYEPLDRIKTYSFAADNFLCEGFTPFSTILGFPRRSRAYDGEEPYVLSTNTIQQFMGDFLTATSSAATPYNTTLEGRMLCMDCNVSDTDSAAIEASNAYWASQSLRWEQSRATCPLDTKWTEGLGTCEPCPVGTYQPAQGETVCIPKPADAGEKGTPVAVAVAVPIVCVLAIGAVVWGVYNEVQKRKNVRNVANAPKGGEVTLMFTDIEASTKLWSTCPQSMSVSLDIHHAVIRECISRHRGYEVKTVGDCFVVAVSSASAGIAIARDIQLELMKHQFPLAIERTYAAENDDDLDAVVDDESQLAPLGDPWNGLRVRIGLHTGEPEVVFDEVAKGYDYYGPPVNLAARVESVTNGGQICISRDVEGRLTDADRAQVHIQLIGAVELKGVAGKTEIIQVTPMSLRARTFAELEEDEEGDDDGTKSVHSSRGSQASFAVNEHTSMCVKTLKALLRTVRPKEKKGVVETLAKSWRISHVKSDDDAMEQIGRRIALIVKKDTDKAEVSEMDSSMLKPIQTETKLSASVGANSMGASGRRRSQSGGGPISDLIAENLPGAADESPL